MWRVLQKGWVLLQALNLQSRNYDLLQSFFEEIQLDERIAFLTTLQQRISAPTPSGMSAAKFSAQARLTEPTLNYLSSPKFWFGMAMLEVFSLHFSTPLCGLALRGFCFT
jgi:hypothetical protein